MIRASVLFTFLCVALACVGASWASVPAYVGEVALTNDGEAVFTDDFGTGGLEGWLEPRDASVVEAKAAVSRYYLCLLRTGGNPASIAHTVSVSRTGVVELTAMVWLPRVPENEKSTTLRLWLRSGTVVDASGRTGSVCVSLDWLRTGGYAVGVRWSGPGAGSDVRASSGGAVVQPETPTDVVLRLDASTGELSALVGSEAKATIRVAKQYFQSINNLQIVNAAADEPQAAPSQPATQPVRAPAKHPIIKEPVRPKPPAKPLPPVRIVPPSEDLPMELRRSGERGGIYLDDILLTNDGGAQFFADFQDGGLTDWPVSRDARAECAGAKGCCLHLNHQGKVVSSAFHRVDIVRAGVVELSAWVWLPPTSEQGSSFTNLNLYSGSTTDNIGAGVKVDTAGRAYRVKLHWNRFGADNGYDDAVSKRPVLQPERWARLTLRLDPRTGRASALLDGIEQASFDYTPSRFQSINQISVWGWLGAKNTAE